MVIHYRLTPLLWAALVGSCLAANEHDHGAKAGAPLEAPTRIQEVALPEGFGSAQSIVVDAGGRVWFTEKVGRKLGVFDPEKKAFAVHALPASWGNMGFSNITLGSDGEIWFTVRRWAEGEEDPHMLGRFTPADGYFTKYALPNRSIPAELIVDAKGVLWFLAANKDSLYRIDPKTFALKGYPIPTANGHPRSLAADGRGHIWFAQSNVNKLGEFVPEQQLFHEYEVPTPFANTAKISIDKQGKIWFVETTANRIGVFSPEQKRFDGAIIPTPGSSPVALLNDDGGNIWFLEYKGNKLGVFNPQTARFREYDIPSYGSLPAEMAIDRQRSLIWFSQSATEAKRLGRVSISEALAQDEEPVGAAPAVAAGKWLLMGLLALAAVAVFGWRWRKRSRG